MDPMTAVDVAPSRVFLERIPRRFAREHLVLSGGFDEVANEERVFATASTSPAALLNLRTRLGRSLKVTRIDAEALLKLLEVALGTDAKEATGLSQLPEQGELDALLASEPSDLLEAAGKGPIVRLVDGLLFEALQQGASDVHFQPAPDHVLVRYRLDGALVEAHRLDLRLLGPVSTRIKVLGRLDVAERRLAQDGRTTLTLGPRHVDARISTFPSRHGERIVLRLLDGSRQVLALDQLGMPEAIRRQWLALAQESHGLILVTGPTGSGKTTTLYATLREAATSARNVMTIEDPVEVDLAALGLVVSQTQVSSKRGITFATGLRHILRQDPDVILVGEIRDSETARLAVQASLTGHLVFATLHTGDADAALRRLVDLGVEEYLVRDSLRGVLSQRLERVIHAACVGQGCPECLGRGFERRRAVYELRPS